MGIIERAAVRLEQTKDDIPAPPPVALQPEATLQSGVITETEVAAEPEMTTQSEAATPGIVAPEANVLNRASSDHSRSRSKRVELDLAALRARGMVTPDGGRSAVAEEFSAIKRTLLERVASREIHAPNRSNLIMVTSCLPGEGKTFCAANLALSMAMELDHTVLLVDADVARPTILRTLGLKGERGLMDILLNRQLDVGDFMLKTNIDTLSILPAGTSHRHATELLASRTMSNLLDELASRYADRIVIFDSPPLLLTNEARVLASQMGEIVMVVEAEKTTQKALKNALRHIEACPNVNLVYNKTKAFAGGDYYGYYNYN